MISWYLFSSSRFSTSMFFLLGRVPHALLCRVFSCILIMVVLSKHGDRESCHDTSVVTFQVGHVVGFGVFIVSQVSSLGYCVVMLFFVSFWRYEGRLFLRCLSVHRVEYCVFL